jgi:hypothetical protein
MSMKYIAMLIASTLVSASAKDIPLDTPTAVTGKLSVSKLGVYITTEDTLSGPGNGFKLSHEPVHHIIVQTKDYTPEKQSPRIEELKKQAGQTVTLHGRFEPLNEKVHAYWGCRAFLELSE